jgi:Mg-chelatase subunit ChlD
MTLSLRVTILALAIAFAPLALFRVVGASPDDATSVADGNADAAFGLDGVLEQQQGPSRQPASACSAVITETVAGSLEGAPLPLCEPAEVQVTIGVTCPTTLPLHLVFVIGRHLLMEDHLDDVKRSARNVLDAIDFTPGTKVGVVSVSLQQRVEQELTESKGSAMSAIQRVRLDRVDPLSRYTDWIGQAQTMLERARIDSDGAAVSPIEVILVYSTGCPNVSGGEAYCNRQVASASKAKGIGITVVGVCEPNAQPFGLPLPPGVMGEHCRWLRQIASQGSYYDLRQASRAAVAVTKLGQTSAGLGLDLVRLDKWLGVGLHPVAGSLDGSPVVTPTMANQALSWSWADPAAGTALTATYQVTATSEGTFALRDPGQPNTVTMVDALGRPVVPLALPPRDVIFEPCVPPTATPTATLEPTPSVTASPAASRTPPAPPPATLMPTPAPDAHSAYLPLVVRAACRKADRPLDVVIVVDASSSMAAVADGHSGIVAARDAAKDFLALLDLAGTDRAAIIAFNQEARVMADLGSGSEDLGGALDAITTAEGTRIDRALNATRVELDRGGRSGATSVVILLTDGRPAPEHVDATLAAGEALSVAAGPLLFVLLLGAEVDASLMAQLSGDPDRVLHAPTPDDLRRVFHDVARELPCPGGAPWN